MKRTRRRFTAEQKAAMLREHLIERAAVSDLCDRHGIQPTLFYRWQKEMLEGLAGLFERQGTSEVKALRERNETLVRKLAHKDRVIAEIMEEYVAVKKSSGES